MNKVKNLSLLIVVFCIIFAVGFFIFKSIYAGNTSNVSEQPVNSVVTEQTPNLTDSDKQFLEEHVYGPWKLVKRVEELDEISSDKEHNKQVNYSDQGVKELTGTDFVYFKEGANAPIINDQTFFSNIRDLYLFNSYGGFITVNRPIYHISTINTKDIALNNIYHNYPGNPCDFFKTEKVIKVYYDLGIYEDNSTRITTQYPGCTLYIVDPSDMNTLYVDFCGLWELQREDNEHYNDKNGMRGKG